MESTLLDHAVTRTVVEMAREGSVSAALERVLAMVMHVVPSADAASVMVCDPSDPSSVVATDEAVRELVERHLVRGASPALAACARGKAVLSGDLGREFRWPEFCHDMTTTLEISSVLAVPLSVSDPPLGALTIYAESADAFDAEDRETAQIAALCAAAVLADARERHHLSREMTARTAIGKATGIVMDQFDVDATTAFSVLRRLSQIRNEQVRDLAARIVTTRIVDVTAPSRPPRVGAGRGPTGTDT